ncbi:MAG: patatin-like phospholipase family protein [Solirubrobacterales bacterium]|jgi:NTE family protein|nr:patatin-like phospholipase family protein [Solirubrobacterales bacterium]
MGKVVELDPPSGRGPKRARGGRRPPRSRTALVLGGGGFTGGVYEIGALRALDLLAVNKTVNEFDVYVGTSAGAFVASLAANGVTPEEMMRVVNQQVPTPFRDIDLGQMLRPNLLEFAAKGALLPLRAALLAKELLSRPGQVSAMDLAVGLAEALPSGFYSGKGIERYVRTVLSDPDRTDDFRMLAKELYLTATDLDTCERIVLGSEGWDDVPISTAVAASTALPMVYSPMKVRERELVDGGLVSTTNLDIAVEAGAKLVVVINPLVPYVNPFTTQRQTLLGTRPRHVSDMGFPQIGYQAFKLLAYQRLHEMAKQWEERYPGVDIVLIEPEPDDELMFQTSMMNFASRTEIARHGFESVTLKLATDYDQFQAVCDKHGIEISPTRVRKVIKHFGAEKEHTRAWRKILEQTTGALLRQSSGSD